MEGARARILAISVGLAELLESGTGIIILFLATVMTIVLGLLLVLSSKTLFDRAKELMRIARGQSEVDTSDREEPMDVGRRNDLPVGVRLSRYVRRRLNRRPRSDRPSVRR